MADSFRTAVQNLANGCRLVAESDDGYLSWKMVAPVEQPDGAVMDRLLREGWVEMMANGGTAKLSDAGLRAYLHSTDELGDGTLTVPNRKTEVE